MSSLLTEDAISVLITHANDKTNTYQLYTEQNFNKFHLKEA